MSGIFVVRPTATELPREPRDRETNQGEKAPEEREASPARGPVRIIDIVRGAQSIDGEPKANAGEDNCKDRGDSDGHLHNDGNEWRLRL